MKNKTYAKKVTRKEIAEIVNLRFSNMECPKCKKKCAYAGSIDTEWDDDCDDEIVLSFDVFCSNCGAVLGKWDNTKRKYLFTDKK